MSSSVRHRRTRKCPGVLQTGDLPAEMDGLVDPGGRKHFPCEAPEFRLEVGIAHRARQRAERVLDMAAERASVPRADGNTRLVLPMAESTLASTRLRTATTRGSRTQASLNCASPAAPWTKAAATA